MKLEISRNLLLDILKTNSSISKNDVFNPVLNCVLIKCNKDEANFIYSNGTINIKTSIKEGFKCIESGSILIKNKFLLDIISKVNGKNILIQKNEEGSCNLSAESFKCQINILDERSFPIINFDFDSKFTKIDLNHKELMKITTKIASCVLNNGENIKCTNGIGFTYDSQKKILSVSGTDSYKLANLLIPLENDKDFSFVMELGVSKIINSMIINADENKKYSLYINKETNELVFESNNMIIMAKNIEGTYLDVSRFFREYGEYSFEIDKHKLISALERGSAFVSNEKVAQFVLKIKKDKIVVDFCSYEFGTSQEEIEITNQIGEFGDLNINAKYLISILKNIENEKAKFNFVYQIKPIILTDPKEPNFRQLVLPIRAK